MTDVDWSVFGGLAFIAFVAWNIWVSGRATEREVLEAMSDDAIEARKMELIRHEMLYFPRGIEAEYSRLMDEQLRRARQRRSIAAPGDEGLKTSNE